jgi:hypothetical protein
MEIIKKSKDSLRGVHGAYVLEEHNVNHLIGQLLTFVDSLGLPEKQERAVCDILKQKIWETMTGAFYINGKILCLAEDMDWELKDEQNQLGALGTTKEERQKGLHPEWIKGDFELKFTTTK